MKRLQTVFLLPLVNGIIHAQTINESQIHSLSLQTAQSLPRPPFQNPQEADVSDGKEFILECKYAKNFIGNDEVFLRSYNGKLVGDTLQSETWRDF